MNLQRRELLKSLLAAPFAGSLDVLLKAQHPLEWVRHLPCTAPGHYNCYEASKLNLGIQLEMLHQVKWSRHYNGKEFFYRVHFIDLIKAMDVTTVRWVALGGMNVNFKWLEFAKK